MTVSGTVIFESHFLLVLVVLVFGVIFRVRQFCDRKGRLIMLVATALPGLFRRMARLVLFVPACRQFSFWQLLVAVIMSAIRLM